MPSSLDQPITRYRKYFKELEPKLHKPRNKAYTTIVFSFLVVSLFGWYAIRPTVQTIILLRREIHDKTELSKKMEEKIAALIEAQAYYQESEHLLSSIDQSLPNVPDAVPLLIQLRNIASLSATTISVIQLQPVPIAAQEISQPKTSSPGNVMPTGKLQTYDIALNIKGPYANVRAFIEAVTQMRRIVTIDGMSIMQGQAESSSSPSAQPNTKLLQLALKLKAYYLVK